MEGPNPGASADPSLSGKGEETKGQAARAFARFPAAFLNPSLTGKGRRGAPGLGSEGLSPAPGLGSEGFSPAPGSGSSAPTPSALKHLFRNPVAAVSLCVLALIVLMAVVYPLISPYSYAHPTDDISAPSSARHWLGTDDSGYDLLTRLAVGARVSLSVGLGVELLVLAVGIPIGLVAGYYGRWTDTLLMRLTDMMFAFPDILLAILIMAVYGQSLGNLFVALTITGWPGLARLVRGQALSLRGREFVEAARALGIPSGQIIRRHVLPNLLSPIIVAATIDIAGVIIAEATLSFLGIGVQDPLPSWGKMISVARTSHYWRSNPSLVIYPALCLSLTVLCLNFLGDALRDALDPRSGENS